MELLQYRDEFREQMISVWARSVRATHLFLTEDDFEVISKLVKMIDFHQFITICAVEDGKVVAGFMAVKDGKLEMLFLDPDHIGKGLGRDMVRYAFDELGVREVEVNEQNTQALGFYKKMGFVPFARNEKDGLGKNYPIISMRLEN